MKFKTILAIVIALSISAHLSGQINFTEENRIPGTDIKSQGKTGTCWSFASTSFIESELLRMGKENLNFSEMFAVRQVYLDKAQNYILRQGKANFSQGALAHDALRMIKLYGMMPEEAYTGFRNPEDSVFKHSELEKGLKGFLDAIIEVGQPSAYWIDAVNGILDAYMSQLPESFSYDGKEYTAKSYGEFIDINIGDYINITSFNHHPYNEFFILEIPDNYSNGQSFNVKLDEMILIIDYALENGYSIAWDGDVGETGFSQDQGIAVLPVDPLKENIFSEPFDELAVTQENRQRNFESYQTTDDHLMHLIGNAKGSDGNDYYIIKNSWGKKGPFEGYLYMSEAYAKMKTISITLHKDGLPGDVKLKY